MNPVEILKKESRELRDKKIELRKDVKKHGDNVRRYKELRDKVQLDIDEIDVSIDAINTAVEVLEK